MKQIIALQEYTDKYVSFYEGEIRNIEQNLADRLIERGIVAEHTEGGDEGGGGFSIDEFAENGLTGSVNLSTASNIRAYTFYLQAMDSVNAENVTTIGEYAFCGCSSLTTVSFPQCTSIGMIAFCSCPNLTTVSFSQCTSIGTGAFQDCSSLTTVNFPQCTSIGASAFYGCTNLTTVSFPQCTSIDQGVFYSCPNLTTVSFPQCTSIGGYVFYSCKSLTTVNFPECTSIGANAFYYCSNLTTASFPKCKSIYSQAFRNCYNLIELHLESVQSVPFLSTSVFLSTPIGGYSVSAGRYGSIFVPASLYSAFQTAQNWSSVASRIVSV